MSKPKDGKWLRWIVLGVGALVVAACASQQMGLAGRFGPVPKIRGTEIAVPRAWEPHVTERPWRYIVIHHSASDTGGAVVFDSWHRKRGFDELGYHFVITNGGGGDDGKVEVGSRWLKQKQGAHAKSDSGEFNEQGIGICLVGNFQNTEPTAQQWQSAIKLVAFLRERYDIPDSRIIGHRDVAHKTQCPGDKLSLETLHNDVDKYLAQAP